MNRATSATGWVRNPDGTLGWTWNPITGCLNHDNGLCKGGGFPCYAYKLAHGRLKPLYLANHNLPFPIIGDKSYNEALLDPFYPRFWEERIEEIITRNEYLDGDLPRPTKPRGIFVCDMGDLFGVGVPEEWTRRVLDAIDWNKYYDRFYLLTKQAARLPEFSPFPDNAWVGVTATNDDMFWRALNCLKVIEAKIKYISVEPLLHEVRHIYELKGVIDWLIIGACTGTFKEMYKLVAKYPELGLERVGNKLPTRLWTVQPKIEWVQEIVEAADRAGIPVFLKDNLKPLLYSECGVYSHPWAFRNWELRQEMPG